MAECKVLTLPGIELHLFRTQPVIDQTDTIRTSFSTYFAWPSFDLHTLTCHLLHVYYWCEGQLFADGDQMTAWLVLILLHDSHLTFSTAVYKHTSLFHTRNAVYFPHDLSLQLSQTAIISLYDINILVCTGKRTVCSMRYELNTYILLKLTCCFRESYRISDG